MATVAVDVLLVFLQNADKVFALGGELVGMFQEKMPELITTPLPNLDEMDKARDDAEKRVEDSVK